MILKFNIKNNAFRYENYNTENIRILKKIINKIEYGCCQAKIYDVNGNHIGEWKI